MSNSTAFREGYLAASQARTTRQRTFCPHPPWSVANKDWMNGWNAFHADFKRVHNPAYAKLKEHELKQYSIALRNYMTRREHFLDALYGCRQHGGQHRYGTTVQMWAERHKAWTKLMLWKPPGTPLPNFKRATPA